MRWPLRSLTGARPFGRVSSPSRHGLLVLVPPSRTRRADFPHRAPQTTFAEAGQVGQRGEPHLWVQFGLLRYLVELCFHHSSASVCADDVSRGQSSFAPPLPHVRGFPALGVLPASPTSLEASAFLRREPYRPAYSMHLLHQDFEGSLRFLDTSISERAVRLTPPQSPVPLP